MKEKKRILFVSQEIEPYLPASPLASLGKNLPLDMNSRGFEVRTFMPRYGKVNERRNQLHEVIRLSGINISISDADHPLILKVASLQPARIQVYFTDNDDYFDRLDSDSDSVGSNRPDNDERSIFFAHGTAETVRKLRWEPVVVHCIGWITALNPLYFRKMYADNPTMTKAKIVYSIFPARMEAPLDPAILEKLVAEEVLTPENAEALAGEQFDTDFLHRMAIRNSDAIIIHDEEISPELMDFVKSSDLPYLIPDQLTSPEAYSDFYNSLLTE